jgi:hypothetical protein
MEWVQYVGLFERKQRMDKVMKKKKVIINPVLNFYSTLERRFM